MSIFIDALVLIIIAVTAFVSLKRGFVRSVMSVLSLFLTVFIISSVSAPISEFIYDKFVHKSVCEAISEKQNEQLKNGAKLTFDALPDFAKDAAEIAGINEQSFYEIINNNSDLREETEMISQKLVRPTAVKIISIIIDIVLFIILMFVFGLISKFLCGFFKLPLLNEANKFLGAVLGILKGAVIAVFVCSLISYIAETSKNGEFLIFNPKTISETVLFKFFSNVL